MAAETAPIHQIARELDEAYDFDNLIDLFRLAEKLRVPEVEFMEFIERRWLAHQERLAFGRKLEGKPPLSPALGQLLMLLVGKVSQWGPA